MWRRVREPPRREQREFNSYIEGKLVEKKEKTVGEGRKKKVDGKEIVFERNRLFVVDCFFFFLFST